MVVRSYASDCDRREPIRHRDLCHAGEPGECRGDDAGAAPADRRAQHRAGPDAAAAAGPEPSVLRCGIPASAHRRAPALTRHMRLPLPGSQCIEAGSPMTVLSLIKHLSPAAHVCHATSSMHAAELRQDKQGREFHLVFRGSLQGGMRPLIPRSDAPNAEDANSEAMEQLRRLHDEYEAYISHAKQTGAACCAALSLCCSRRGGWRHNRAQSAS